MFSKLDAVTELEILGVIFPPDLKEKLKISEVAKMNQKKAKRLDENNFVESDEYIAYIIGYTSVGAPYDVTWEEMEEYSEKSEMGSDDDEQILF